MLPPIVRSLQHIAEVRAGLEMNLDALASGTTLGVKVLGASQTSPSPLMGEGWGEGVSLASSHTAPLSPAPLPRGERGSNVLKKVAPLGVPASSPLHLVEPDKEIGNANFFLAYHGLNNRDLQVKLARLYETACPELLWNAPHCLQKKPRNGPLKIGFISRFMHNHSIGKTTAGLLAELSREQFRVYALLIPPLVDDELSRFIRSKADETHVLPLALAAARQKIAELELDILFYQDIGMEPFGYFLAFARLAPVQCVTFGHPDTTGIRNMDYWVSNDLFEPEDAQAHYSEQLFLLHDLGTLAYYYRPKPPSPAKTRADFNLPEDATLYLCPQTLFKFHPDFDAILAGILRADPRARIVLIEAKIPYWVELLRQRFAQTFPDVLERVMFVPQQKSHDFIALLAAADVILDTPHFNGMNTSLEAFAVGTPVVTWPRALQRGRHTYGMYRKMGMDECIAKDADDYVAIAVRLSTDPTFRAEVKAKILARNTALYEDQRVVREFERFFLEASREPKPDES
jgi:predicted O-linked N-acetylglucosamine transferase (SPINDLY family)